MTSTETGFTIRHSILSFDVGTEAFNLELRKPEHLDGTIFQNLGYVCWEIAFACFLK